MKSLDSLREELKKELQDMFTNIIMYSISLGQSQKPKHIDEDVDRIIAVFEKRIDSRISILKKKIDQEEESIKKQIPTFNDFSYNKIRKLQDIIEEFKIFKEEVLET